MLKTIHLRTGRYSENRKLSVHTAPMTVVVGPNNSGKSLLLRELRGHIDHNINRTVKLLLSVDFRAPAQDEAARLLSGASGRRFPWRSPATAPHDGDYVQLIQPGKPGGHSFTANVEKLVTGRSDHLRELASLLSMHLDGAARLSILLSASGVTVEAPLSALVDDPDQTKRLSALVHEATGWHLCIEARPMMPARSLLSRRPLPQHLEQSHSPEAQSFWKDCVGLDEFSDGLRAFVGMLGAFLSGDFRIFTIDEPEAFLHPPLARRLGRILTQLSHEMMATTVVSSHSPEFLMGCIQSRRDTTVLRLTYEGDVASAQAVSAEHLQAFMQDPLLRSSGVLNALFHRCAVVSEADTDRAFYEEVNLRLLSSPAADGVDDCCFLNVNGKDTVDRVVAMLRQMGVPTAAIVDLDMLKAGRLGPLLRAAGMPDLTQSRIMSEKGKLIESFGGQDPKAVGTKGSSDPGAVDDALQMMAAYGVFLVPQGEVERWLPNLGAKGHGPPWLTEIFRAMGSDSSSDRYVRPASGDVWDFLRAVCAWLKDGRRKGMPSDNPSATDAHGGQPGAPS